MKEGRIYCGDCLEVMHGMGSDSVDCIVTDPPYGLSFMGKDWDKAVPSIAIWQECLRVLKPGAFAFVMCIPRQDCLARMMCRLEDAGFNISFSSIYHTFATGFPKALNLGKKDGALSGMYGGMQLKPAVEVVIVAMKPIEGNRYLDQALKNGHGCTWLDDVRIPLYKGERKRTASSQIGFGEHNTYQKGTGRKYTNQGRFPTNLLCEDDVLHRGKITRSTGGHPRKANNSSLNTYSSDNFGQRVGVEYTDPGSFSRYFSLDAWFSECIKSLPKEAQKTFPWLIVPKASKSERNRGLEDRANTHPTCKPIKLMSWLMTLASREGDIVLDPFCGSGTTLIAAKMLGRQYIGIEREEDYCEIARKRVKVMYEKNILSYLSQER